MLIKALDTRSRAIQAAFAAAGITLLVFAAQELLQLWGPGFQVVSETWLYTALEVCAVTLCAAAAIRRSSDRAQWILLTAGLALWTIGDGLWTFWLETLQPAPYPSIADVAYVLGYLCFFAGLSTLLVRRLRHSAAALWLDGLVAGFTLAAVGWALVVPTILASPHSTLAATALDTAYVLLDLLLLVGVAVGYALSGWRAGRRMGILAAALLILAVADLTYLYGEATASVAFRNVDDVMWPLMMLLVALAAWQAPEKEASRRHTGRETVLVPGIFGLISLGVLVRATQVPVDAGAVAFATAAMLVAGTRATLTYLENVRMLDRQTSDAVTDALTGLRNRRALIDELTSAVARSLRGGDPLTLCFFDLNGFKHYNDSFGHAAGDELLRRLGSAVAAAVEPDGRAYRLGGDEFCVLLSGRFDADSEPVRLAGRMLSERGEGFAVSAACGVVVVPDDADELGAALALADRRMYRDKDRTSRTGRGQIHHVLMRVLAEREPALSEHTEAVGELALSLARSLGVEGEALDEIRRAVELHDVGKLAIPDAILTKPGPLSADEWKFMRQHTIIGERILSVAPAMVQVGRLVRSTHERWDGAGYPDGLAGDEIPLGSRIIAVCDAFHAITSERPYDTVRTQDEAVDELLANAATQFDPSVVAAMCRVLRRADADVAPASSARRRSVSG